MSDHELLAEDRVQFTAIDFNVAVDGNRNGAMDFDHSDDKQITFWYNNDADRSASNPPDVPWGEPDYYLADVSVMHQGRAHYDSDDSVILNTRDLEDLFPYHVIFSAIALGLPEAELHFAKTGNADYRIFRQAVATADNPHPQVRDAAAAEQQLSSLFYKSAAGLVETGHDVALPLNGFGQTVDSYVYMPFLVEAIAPMDGQPAIDAQLSAVLEYRYPDARKREIRQDVTTNLHDVKDFYSTAVVSATEAELKAVDFATLAEAFLPDAEVTRSQIVGQPFFNGHDGTVDSVVFVHGWNMKPMSKYMYADTMYKRLYWQGFQGEFFAFHWPTLVDEDGEIPPVTPHSTLLNLTYNPSEYEALRSGKALERISKPS